MTPTFIPDEALAMPGYELFASPTLHPEQSLKAVVRNEGDDALTVRLALRQYGSGDRSELIAGEAVTLGGGTVQTLAWQVSGDGSRPIHAVGLEIEGRGSVALDSMTWGGVPSVTFTRPDDPSMTLWRRAWVDAVDHFQERSSEAFRISQNEGRSLMAQGTRDWIDYAVTAEITPYLARNAGIAIRVQGLKRYYALLLGNDQIARLVKMDDFETVLSEVPFAWDVFTPYTLTLRAEGDCLTGRVNDAILLSATDPGSRLTAGGAGFVIEEGTMGSDTMTVSGL
jgi:hypothetical protein